MELISVIVPVYMVEPYLDRCIKSLQSQTYRNIEIILVDDGSLDHSPILCDKYASEDNRIKVIHKENGGLSDARNAGLAIASGEMIAFVDSDDWVSPEYLKIMYEAMQETDADIVECGFLRTDGKGAEVAENEKLLEEPGTGNRQMHRYSTEEALEDLILDQHLHQVVWNKLYRRAVCSRILFAVGKYNEDEFWTYQIFGNAKVITKIDAVLYYYFQNAASIMGQGFKLKRLDAVEAKMQRQNYMDQYYPSLSSLAATNLMQSIIYAGQMSILYLPEKEKTIALDRLEDAVNRTYRINHHPFVGSRKQIIWCQMAKYCLSVVCRIRNRLKMNVE